MNKNRKKDIQDSIIAWMAALLIVGFFLGCFLLVCETTANIISRHLDRDRIQWKTEK